MTTVRATDEGLEYTVDDCLLCPLNAEGYCRPLGAYWAHAKRLDEHYPPAGCPLRQGTITLRLHPLSKGFEVVPDSNPDGFVVREVAVVAEPDPACEFIGERKIDTEAVKRAFKPWEGRFLPWGKITQ